MHAIWGQLVKAMTSLVKINKNMGKTTSAERMRKLRERRSKQEDYDHEKFKEKERKRIANYRLKRKKEVEKSKHKLEEQRRKERVRKQIQRQAKKGNKKQDGRISANAKSGRKRADRRKKTTNEKIDNLTLKVKLFKNENRRLKRRILENVENVDDISEDNDTLNTDSEDSVLLSSVSPSAKLRAKKRLSLSNPSQALKRKFHFDRLNFQEKDVPLKSLVEKFMFSDENSVVTPDTKKAKKGIRYRLASIEDLHQKFLVDMNVDCSYAQFARYVPDCIKKPKPEDWGTCLCMVCLNPELKLEAIKKAIPSTSLTLPMIKDGNHKSLITDVCNELKAINKPIKYLEWSKDRGTDVKATTYFSKKNALESTAEEFVKKFLVDTENLESHAKRFKVQYRRIGELKNLIAETPTAKLIRIDWSENAELYQTRQEKSQYYTSVSVSINTAVLYEHESTRSFATISDVKSHKAEATWASLSKIFAQIDLKSTDHLYIASDSPSSQYRNKKNVILMKACAVMNDINLTWVFTETGHGKGPMDGVGGSLKKVIKDTIAYHPNGVIRNTSELMNHLPSYMQTTIVTYDEEDVKEMMKYLTNLKQTKIVSKIGITKIHEITCDANDDKAVAWRELSEGKSIEAKLVTIKKR